LFGADLASSIPAAAAQPAFFFDASPRRVADHMSWVSHRLLAVGGGGAFFDGDGDD